MNTYSFTPSDARKQQGLEAATGFRNDQLRADYNAQQLMLPEEDRTPYVPITVQDYVQFVMDGACESYANQFAIPQGA